MRRLIMPALAFTLLACTGSASAVGVGGQAGVSMNPDQFYIGGHGWLGKLSPNLEIRPTIEVGFGDDVTTWALNAGLAHRFTRPEGAIWGYYAGAEFAVNIFARDGDSETELGLNLMVGTVRDLPAGNEMLLEMKLGLADSPEVKIGIGMTIH